MGDAGSRWVRDIAAVLVVCRESRCGSVEQGTAAELQQGRRVGQASGDDEEVVGCTDSGGVGLPYVERGSWWLLLKLTLLK